MSRPLLLLLPLLSLAACARPAPEPEGAPPVEVAPLDNPAPSGSRVPALAGGGGTILLAWVAPGSGGRPVLAASRLRDGAWSEPSVVSSDAAIVTDPASPPAAAVLADGTLAVAWSVKNPGGEHASDVRVAFSRDGGATWSDPETPHRDGTATEHGFVSMLPDASGGLDLLWLDGRSFATSTYGEGGTQIFHARWDGSAFGPETAIDRKVCDCCRTASARPGGVLVAAYRDRGDDERRDISTSRLEAGGWSEPRGVRDDGWRLQACPANGPAIAAQGDRTLLAWFTAAGGEPTVRTVVSPDGGRSFGEGVRLDAGFPVGRIDAVSLGGAGFAVSWLEKTGGRAEVRVRHVHPDGGLGGLAVPGVTDAGRASGTPRLVASEDGRALLAWTDTAAGAGVRTAWLTF